MAIESYDHDKAQFLKELESLRPDLIYSEGWTEKQKADAVDLVRPTRTKTNMLSAIPMRCLASRCVYAEVCPLLKQNLAPEGSMCPIELSMVLTMYNDYVEELDVDVTRMVEVSLVRDIVNLEIQQIRASKVLGMEHFIQENVVGVDSEGNVVTKKELHQAVEYEDRISRRKEKLLKQLLATRESRAKVGQNSADSAQVIANILEDVRKVELANQRKIRAELGLSEFDEYIDADVVEEDPIHEET